MFSMLIVGSLSSIDSIGRAHIEFHWSFWCGVYLEDSNMVGVRSSDGTASALDASAG